MRSRSIRRKQPDVPPAISSNWLTLAHPQELYDEGHLPPEIKSRGVLFCRDGNGAESHSCSLGSGYLLVHERCKLDEIAHPAFELTGADAFFPALQCARRHPGGFRELRLSEPETLSEFHNLRPVLLRRFVSRSAVSVNISGSRQLAKMLHVERPFCCGNPELPTISPPGTRNRTNDAVRRKPGLRKSARENRWVLRNPLEKPRRQLHIRCGAKSISCTTMSGAGAKPSGRAERHRSIRGASSDMAFRSR